ncbi:hypothetical protein F383_36846 [Gossypium arboreum]|uniref:Uncharacterized protein n=1 Tax=Gossypium arboreum TaxID=29729 RepID=A0A0B0MAW4_GOSAR|nr:hypothetical protein F383_36846 [Gossypium arboreum]
MWHSRVSPGVPYNCKSDQPQPRHMGVSCGV